MKAIEAPEAGDGAGDGVGGWSGAGVKPLSGPWLDLARRVG